MDTDSLVGATAGLLAVGIMAHAAGHMIRGPKKSKKKQKGLFNMKHNKTTW